MHEIITLQLGQQSNYLATHFWNTQESYFKYAEGEESEIDPNVHFRPGIGVDGTDTFTPRTLIYDLKGGFGTLRQYNELYDAREEGRLESIRGLWDGVTIPQRQSAIQQHEYQTSLELGLPAAPLTANTVRYWSDFNRVYFHPKSIVQLNEFELGSQILPFENWSSGEELFRDIDKEFDILDRDLRPFAEECDQISAFQLFTGADDAWGGFAANYVDRIRDEYGKTSLWTFAIEDRQPFQLRERVLRSINTARSLSFIATQASAYIRIASPLQSCPPYLRLDTGSEWYCSALSAVAVESITLPSRLRGGASRRANLSDFEAILNTEGNQTIFDLSTSIIPDKEQSVQTNGHSNLNSRGVDMNGHMNGEQESHEDEPLDMRFTPKDGGARVGPKHHRTFGQIFISRGSSDYIGSERSTEHLFDDSPVIERYTCDTPFPLLDSFPTHLFDMVHNPNSVNVETALSASSQTKYRIQNLRQVVQRSVGLEDRENLSNSLAEISEAYESGWMSSESDDDD